MSDVQATVEYRDLSSLGFPGYRVGDDGSVWSCRKIGKKGVGNGRGCRGVVGDTWKRLQGNKKKCGYFAVTICGECHSTIYIHTLVLLAFVGPRPVGMEACHGPDRNPANNALVNLRWGTRLENAHDCLRDGTQTRGETSGKAKLTNEKVIAIRTEYIHASAEVRGNGPILAQKYNVSTSTIYRIVKNQGWQHVD